MSTQTEVGHRLVSITSSDKAEVTRFVKRMLREGATLALSHEAFADYGAWSAQLWLPQECKRLMYLTLRQMARDRGCLIYLDVYERRQYLRIKGEHAHDLSLQALAERFAGRNNVRVYEAHADMRQRFPGYTGHGLAITLTGMDIIRSRT